VSSGTLPSFYWSWKDCQTSTTTRGSTSCPGASWNEEKQSYPTCSDDSRLRIISLIVRRPLASERELSDSSHDSTFF